jgi:hypothetical protein
MGANRTRRRMRADGYCDRTAVSDALMSSECVRGDDSDTVTVLVDVDGDSGVVLDISSRLARLKRREGGEDAARAAAAAFLAFRT